MVGVPRVRCHEGYERAGLHSVDVGWCEFGVGAVHEGRRIHVGRCRWKFGLVCRDGEEEAGKRGEVEPAWDPGASLDVTAFEVGDLG